MHAGASRCTAAGAGTVPQSGKVTAAPCACTWCPPGHAIPPSPVKVVLIGVSLCQFRSESFRGNTEGGKIARRGVIRCLEVQGDACGIVRDVGIICSLTRCRSRFTGTVATRGGYRPGGARSWPSVRLVPLDSVTRAQSSPSSRVHVPGSCTVRGCPAGTEGLTANLQGFRISHRPSRKRQWPIWIS